MRAGQLRHRITIEQLAGTQDSRGQVIPAWNAVATVWGSVEDVSGREFFDAAVVGSEITTRIRIRYRTGIDETMQAISNGRTFQIKNILNPDGRNRELHLMCRELKAWQT